MKQESKDKLVKIAGGWVLKTINYAAALSVSVCIAALFACIWVGGSSWKFALTGFLSFFLFAILSHFVQEACIKVAEEAIEKVIQDRKETKPSPFMQRIKEAQDKLNKAKF